VAIEKMVVIDVKEKSVIVGKKRDTLCGHCSLKNVCTAVDEDIRIEIDYEDGDLKEGDIVLVESPRTGPLEISVKVYLIPLILFVSGIIFGNSVLKLKDVYSFLLGISSVLIYYTLLRFFDKREVFKIVGKVPNPHE